jgi:iron complex outermembrane receptor protein
MRRAILNSVRSIVVCALVVYGSDSRAQSPAPHPSINELKKLSVDQLTDVEVTLVSRAEERLGGAPAAVTVVTNEEIRRSGATSVPEALRLVPGIHVARQTSNTWAISSRGFSSVSSEKLLVLSDTRSIYTPLFSGVFWDVQDYLLQDIDRIEVVRGPGATLWGSNAVNGVINITTKSAKDTQGLYSEASVGSENRTSAAARYGGRFGDRGYYRVFGSFVDRDTSFIAPGPTSDDWRLGHLGARTDWESLNGSSLTIQGDLYHGSIGRLSPSVSVAGRPGPSGSLDVDVTGGNVLGRYRRRTSKASEIELRVYYDQTHRDDPSFLDDLHTVDADFQQRVSIGARQEVTWGVSDRLMANRNRGKVIFALEPPSSRDNLVSGFAQDQLTLRKSLRLTAGTKLEHNDFSGFEIQPSARVAWDVSPPQTVWVAVSRAVRVPTRLERDIAIDVTNPAGNPVVRLLGNGEFESEKLLAYEVGYRRQVLRPVFIDVAAFHNRYDGLASLEREAPFVDPTGRTVIPIRNRNLTDGHSTGVEVLGTVMARQNWRVNASYAYLDLTLDPHGQDLNRGRFFDGATPQHQFGLRSFVDLPASFQLDGQLRSLSAVRRLPPLVSGTGIDGYTELDLRLAWRGWQQMELSIVGQNLLRPHHAEFGPPGQRGEVERGMYAKVAWGF